MAKEFTDKEYAEYMFANRYLDYLDVALFIGAILFEKYIMDKIKAYKKEYLDNRPEIKFFSLNDAIQLYMEKGFWRSDILYTEERLEEKKVRHELHLYKRLRNAIAHEDSQVFHNKTNYRLKKTANESSEDIKLDKFFRYVYISIAGDKVDKKCFNKNVNKTILQDYKIKEINERMLHKVDLELNTNSMRYQKFTGFISQDFDNLFKLREKMIPLQKYISNSLKDIGLEPTILSPIDTTSAYIWMPFVDKKFIKSTNDIIETKRHNLVMGSTSILATPLDFRIYIDFGGGDIDFRSTYQKFIQTKSFKEYVKNHFGAIEPPLKIFETRWYSAIVDEKNLLDFIDQHSYAQQIENAQIFLKNAKAQNNIITSGRNLIGFILPSSEEISKEFILERFKDIAHLYYEYLIYRYPNDEQSLRKKQECLFYDDKADENQDFFTDNLDDYDQYNNIYDDVYDDEELMNPITFK